MSLPEQQPASSEPLPSKPDAKSEKNDKFFGCIAVIAIGVVCLVLGMVFVSTTATEERIVGYEEDPANWWQQDAPIYQTYIYHPFWKAGVIILILGFVLLIGGIVGVTLTVYHRMKI